MHTSGRSPVSSRARPADRARRACMVSTIVAAIFIASPGAAQQVERPITFDTAQRVTAITPSLATRLGLTPPLWPVLGAYREARLYGTADGYVIVVQRQDGAMERYPLDAASGAVLRNAVTSAMAAAGNPTGEPGSDAISEPAGFAFARRQLVVGALVYGPTLAALSSDGSTGAALYLLGTGVPFFAALAYSRESPVTQAQNDLASDAGPRFALMTSGAFYAATGHRRKETYLATVLAGAISGTVAGIRVGRTLTDGEAAGMIAGSNVTAAVTAGTMATLGMFDEQCRDESVTYIDWSGQQVTRIEQRCRGGTSRADYAVLVGAGLVGYPLGRRYVRRAPYAITAGDIRTLYVTGLTGMLATSTVMPDDVDDRAAAAILTTGLVAGLLAGDRLLVKPYDYTRGEGLLLGTGAIGGALLGLAIPVGGQVDESRVYLGAMSLGAIGGIAFTHSLIEPRRGLRRSASHDVRRPTPTARTDARHAPRFQFDPTALALAAARQPGRHSVLSLTF